MLYNEPVYEAKGPPGASCPTEEGVLPPGVLIVVKIVVLIVLLSNVTNTLVLYSIAISQSHDSNRTSKL